MEETGKLPEENQEEKIKFLENTVKEKSERIEELEQKLEKKIEESIDAKFIGDIKKAKIKKAEEYKGYNNSACNEC